MASFFTHALNLSWGTASGNANIFGNNPTGNDFLTNSDFPPGCDWNPLPGALTLERLAVVVSAAPGTNFTFQPFKGIPKVDTGPAVVLLSGSTNVEGPVAVTVNAPTVVGDLATQAFGWTGTSSGGSINGRTMWKYSVASPFDKYTVFGSGFSSANFFVSTATRFLSLNSGFISSATEANTQSAMPIAGTFKYLLVAMEEQDTSGDSTYTATLRVNGSDVISTTLTNAASPALGTETSTSAAVLPGDLVCFSFTTSGPVAIGHRARVYAAVGFLPA